MKFTPLPIAGAFVVEGIAHEDERGFFARTWCKKTFAERGLDATLDQTSISYNHLRGTLRGLHYQLPPYAETKLVRCTQGAIYDLLLDLRPDSPSYTQWHAEELSATNHRALYIPKGCAHGFLTLADGSEVLYQISGTYHPESARGVHWQDPAFALSWPFDPVVIHPRDQGYAAWQPHG